MLVLALDLQTSSPSQETLSNIRRTRVDLRHLELPEIPFPRPNTRIADTTVPPYPVKQIGEIHPTINPLPLHSGSNLILIQTTTGGCLQPQLINRHVTAFLGITTENGLPASRSCSSSRFPKKISIQRCMMTVITIESTLPIQTIKRDQWVLADREVCRILEHSTHLPVKATCNDGQLVKSNLEIKTVVTVSREVFLGNY